MDNNNIKKAAELAGVSVASVSRALNGKPGISEKTRKRIIEICQQLGYQPSQAARRLKIGKASHIGLLLGLQDKASSHYVANLFERLNQQLLKDGLVLSIYNHDDMASLLNESSAAILIGIDDYDPRPQQLRKMGIPFVVIGRYPGEFWVCPDDEQGGRIAAEHLYQLGCQQNIIIESDLRGKGTKSRAIGFQLFMQEKGCLTSNLYVDSQSSMELHAYRSISQLLQKQALHCDALFCENDAIAYGAIFALSDAGIKVPDDVKVIGFDGIPDAYPTITTIRQDLSEIANAALALLNEAKANKSPQHRIIPVTLIEGKSTVIEP